MYSRDPANADKAYELAVKARKALPDDPDMANILAEISFQRKEYSRALQLLRESASKQAPDPEHLYYFGMCAFYTKQNSQARSALDQALAAGLKDPLAADARRALQDLKN